MDNEHIVVNTELLRNYGTRIANVNSRINSLDTALRGLYWQVGLLDLWDVIVANLLTRESPTLNQTRTLLNNSAQRFEVAESNVRRMMGG